MFYSQIILAKKGPLGKVWQAAHWGDKKLGRPAIFATDIIATVDSIVHPAAPMALRVSGHLLLGVVRIYSRQVKFLLDDCQQAMVKVKMAYSNNSNSNGEGGGTIDIAVTTTTRASAGAARHSSNHLNVSNFGEYAESNTDFYTTTFSMPLEDLILLQQQGLGSNDLNDDEQDWIPAELDESALLLFDDVAAVPAAETDRMTLDDTTTTMTLPVPPDQEPWGEFDPMDEDDEEEENAATKGPHLAGEAATPLATSMIATHQRQDDSTVSDIEITRAAAANESLTSDLSSTNIRRDSVLQNDSRDVSIPGGGSVSETDFPMDQGGGDDLMGDEDEDRMRKMNLDDRMLENDDDSDRRRQSLRLSLSRDDSARGDAGISFGDEDSLTAAAPPAEANRKSVEPLDGTAKNNNKRKWTDDKKKKRRRRGRKADLDEGHTELTNEHIRSMLADTSRVVASDGGIHPATWVPENETRRHGGRKNLFRSNRQLLSSHLSYEQRLCRPALSDDGQLVPKLLNLWARNCGPVGGQSLDYEMVADVVGEQQGAESNPPVEGEPDEEEEEGSVEMTRAGGGGGDSMEEEDHPQGRVENEIPQADDDGFPETDGGDNPFDGDNGGVGIDPSGFPDDNVAMADYSPAGNSSQRSIESIFSLGATNGLDEADVVDFGGDYDDDDMTGTTTSKWHKNTVKVFDVLKKNLGDDSKEFVSYNELSEGVSRRTAAGFFFELLQLKTLNYIELNQYESYGDIKVSVGTKFLEDLPTTTK